MVIDQSNQEQFVGHPWLNEACGANYCMSHKQVTKQLKDDNSKIVMQTTCLESLDLSKGCWDFS